MVASRPLSVAVAAGSERLNAALAFCGLLTWFAYTRFFWPLKAINATLPLCPFLFITGHPCPFCGGTRSFASVWQGDLAQSLRFHPLGPLLFAAAAAAALVALGTAVSGRRLVLRLGRRIERRLYVVAGALLAVSWGLKLLWLGN